MNKGLLRKHLDAYLKHLPKDALLFVTFEGERVVPAVEDANPHGLLVELDRHWRPDGEVMPPGIEPIPGYLRPTNWRQLEAASNQGREAIGFNNQIWEV